MANPAEGLDDLTVLRSKRGVEKGAMTRIRKCITALDADKPDSWNVEALKKSSGQLEDHITRFTQFGERILEVLVDQDTSSGYDGEETVLVNEQARGIQIELDLNRCINMASLSKYHAAAVRSIRSIEHQVDLKSPSFNDDIAQLVTKLRALGELDLDQDHGLARTLLDFNEELLQKCRVQKRRWESDNPSDPPASSSAGTSAEPSSGCRHHDTPKIPVPEFMGSIKDWAFFKKQFEAYLSDHKVSQEANKVHFLLKSMVDREAKDLVMSWARKGCEYASLMEQLHQKFGCTRQLYRMYANESRRLEVGTVSKQSLDNLQEQIGSIMQGLEENGSTNHGCVLTAQVESSMPPVLKKDWMAYAKHLGVSPKASDLQEFLREVAQQFDAEELAPKYKRSPASKVQGSYQSNPNKPSDSTSKNHYQQRSIKKETRIASYAVREADCIICHNGTHRPHQCNVFKNMTVEDRFQCSQRNRLCHNCLGTGHTSRDCPSSHWCRTCNRRHHTLLHRTTSRDATPTTTTPPERTGPVEANVTSFTTYVPRDSIIEDPHQFARTQLGLVQVVVKGGGRTRRVRALLDSGSMGSFMDIKTHRALQSPKIPGRQNLVGLGGKGPDVPYSTRVELYSLAYPEEPPLTVVVSVMDAPANILPTQRLESPNNLPFIKGLPLADPQGHIPGPVELLLGADVMAQIQKDELRSSRKDNMIATHTTFGWVIGGNKIESKSQSGDVRINNVTMVPEEESAMSLSRLDITYRKFWELEEDNLSQSTLTVEDQAAVDHFDETHQRSTDGRYQVALPKKTPTISLGKSRGQAIRRYRQTEKSLIAKQQLSQFLEVVHEYIKLEHAELVPADEEYADGGDSYYLPMHGVSKESSTTTKLRVVFDASARTDTGHSLNDALLSGPTLYPQLASVLMRFRRHKIGMTADISKMFREVALDPKDRNLHRFLAPEQAGGHLKTWRMKRLTFGVTTSPFLATQVLRQLASDHQDQFPEAAHIVKSTFYVDDCLTGTDDVTKATRLRTDLNQLLSKGRMKLRKWRTNSMELLKTIPKEMREEEPVQLLASPDNCQKTLGIHWDTRQDTLHVSTPVLDSGVKPTKRVITSEVARMFDIVGWFSPVTLRMKVLLQKLWETKLEWDEVAPDHLIEPWQDWRKQLSSVTTHGIPRCYQQPSKQSVHQEVHGFCDASKHAYAAVVYLKTIYQDQTCTVALVTSKTKVAPIKGLTIPRLELCGAELLSRVVTGVISDLDIPLTNVWVWSDSSIVLSWLRTKPARWKVYVSNRLQKTVSLIPADRWRHVPTKTNPADVASRGCSPNELLDHSLWWEGPEWLHHPPDEWPSLIPHLRDDELPEARVFNVYIPDPQEEFTVRFSDFTRCVRVAAWIFRFITNTRRPQPSDRTPSLTLIVAELEHAEAQLVISVQQQHYPDDRDKLAKGKEISVNSALRALLPYLDEKKVLRVGGRLQNANLTDLQKHPAIVPRRSHLAKLLAAKAHQDTKHSGPTTTLSLLAQTYYISGAKSLVKGISRSCVTCRRTYAKTSIQQMAQLPAVRVTPSPPFHHVGVDYAGPILLTRGYIRKPQLIKAYIAVFICLTTRAIHLELVSDLTSEAFIAALKRFTSRRGKPALIISDNGSNFVGARRELQEIYNLMSSMSSPLQQHLANQSIEWRHIPARAPHFGGMWEAAVKSAKILLQKTLYDSKLHFEEYVTVLAEVEAVLNSRPLMPLDSMSEDGVQALTPGHFLIGRPLLAIPTRLDLDRSLSLGKRWKLCCALVERFWDIWSKDYLTLLQRHQKWTKAQPNIAVGDVVLVKDAEHFVKTWPIALVKEIHPGKDGLVRVVTIRMHGCDYRRPIVKLVVLVPQSSRPPEDVRVHEGHGASQEKGGVTDPQQVPALCREESRRTGKEQS